MTTTHTRATRRRPKPVNQDKRKTLRYDRSVEDAVDQLQRAVARNNGVSLTKVDARGVPLYVKQLDFSKAIRLLVVKNLEAAKIMAGRPEAWPTSETLELPDELWDGLTDCGNKLSHSQGSLYSIMRKLNFDDRVSRDELREVFEAVQKSKFSVARLEALMVAFLGFMAGKMDAAGAESDGAER